VKFYNARRKYTSVDGVLVPVVSGGDGTGDDDAEGDEDDEDEGDDDKPKGKVFTQQDIDRITNKLITRGRRSATKELLGELGLESVDDLKAAIAKANGSDDESQGELAALKEQVRKDQEKAARDKAEAAQDRFDAKVERRLVKAQADPDRVEKIARLLDLSLEDEPDVEDIDAAIADLKEDYPELFSPKDSDDDDEDRGRSKMPDSDTGRQPKRTAPKGSADDRAKAKLLERHPELAKS
jgi:hypothetical protein